MSHSVRKRLCRPVTVTGTGLHSGTPVTVHITPADWGSGRVFQRDGVRIPARLAQVIDTRRSTTLGADGVSVQTVEHLLAALLALGVTDATLHCDGPELPALDGSAGPWRDAVQQAGLEAGPELVPVTGSSVFEDGERRARLTPGPTLRLTVHVDFGAQLPGGTLITTDPASVLDARTFALTHEIEALRAAGLARGGGLHNAVVFEHGRPLNPEGLRRPDEPVAHKALDALGDWSLLGDAVSGHLEVWRGGHAVHVALLEAVKRG